MVQRVEGNGEFFVATATVVGRLVAVVQTARELSLAAKNAKAIAERAGAKASGFRPITDFIDAMGRETRELVDRINAAALAMSRDAVNEVRVSDRLTRLRGARQRLSTPHVAIDRLIGSTETEIAAERERLRNELRTLLDLLDGIGRHMRAASVISTRSRVEATHAAEYQSSLQVVADTVENASESIRRVVLDCIDRLRSAA